MIDDLETELREGLHRGVATIPVHPPPRDGLFDQVRARRRRRVAGASVALVSIVAVLFVGIGAMRRPTTVEVVDTADATTNLMRGASAANWLRLLGHVPRSAASGSRSGSQVLSIVDLARARQHAGVAALPPNASDADVRTHLETLFGAGSVPVIEPQRPTVEQLRAELGFGHDQIDQVITGYANVDSYVAIGRFEPSRIADAVKADPAWGPLLETRTHRGITYYRWGRDRALVEDPTPVRNLGQGGRLVVAEGWLAWSRTDAEAEVVIDASLDPDRSLAGVRSIRLAVEAADEAQLTVFVLRDDAPDDGPGPKPGLPPIEAPIEWSGGNARTTSGSVDQFVMTYATDGQATANLEAFRQTFAAFDGGSRAEIEAHGPMLVALLRSPPDRHLEIMGETADGTRWPLDAGNLRAFFSVRREPLTRPALPDPRPTEQQALADGQVTDEEYALAFWTYVECAEAAGTTFRNVSRAADGQFRATTAGNVGAGDDCYRQHFMDVDMTWQVAHG